MVTFLFFLLSLYPFPVLSLLRSQYASLIPPTTPGVIPVYPALPPQYEGSYNMNDSTILMPCNYSGYYNSTVYSLFGVADFDWSNDKGVWSAATPMSCQVCAMHAEVIFLCVFV